MIDIHNINNLIIDSAYKYYKQNGFPYVKLTPQQLLLDFKKLFESNPIISKRRDFYGKKYYSVGCDLSGVEFCKHFMPHQFKVKITNPGSPYDAFLKNDDLKKAIKMAYEYTGSIDDKKLRSYLSRVNWHQFATNFRPSAAKAIYNRYGKNRGIIYDYCGGFGGRLLGFLSSKFAKTSRYICTDPSTESINGLIEITKFLNAQDQVNIYKKCAEDFCPDELYGQVDFAFSSPPYFAKERYSDEQTQSYKKYSRYYLWNIFFLKKVITNCYKLLKHGGYFAINIENVKIKGELYPCSDDAEKFCNNIFGKQHELLVLPMGMIFGSTEGKKFECDDTKKKMEKIFVYRKE